MKKLEIAIPVDNLFIKGNLTLVSNSKSLVVFAHGSGSSRHSARNIFVADFFNKGGISTFLFDLLTEQEDILDQITREFRFNIPLLAERLILVTQWLQDNNDTSSLTLGYFGASTGAAAALIAAAQMPDIKAVVSRGGRPDLAAEDLAKVTAATLFIVGELDFEVIKLNQMAYDRLRCTKELYIVPGATHLFEEHGTLEHAAQVALGWFSKFLP